MICWGTLAIFDLFSNPFVHVACGKTDSDCCVSVIYFHESKTETLLNTLKRNVLAMSRSLSFSLCVECPFGKLD